jgi:hypothetical protein
MSNVHYPDDFEIDYHADLQWRRQHAALQSLAIGDVLAEVDDLIAQEPDEQNHPLYSLVAHALDRVTMPGTAEGLMSRYGRLIDHAIERLVEQRLADPTCWEVD